MLRKPFIAVAPRHYARPARRKHHAIGWFFRTTGGALGYTTIEVHVTVRAEYLRAVSLDSRNAVALPSRIEMSACNELPRRRQVSASLQSLMRIVVIAKWCFAKAIEEPNQTAPRKC
jgi:hypothetical protein